MAKKIMRHASALKAKRQNIARKAKNFQIRNRVRTLTKKVMEAIADKNKEAAAERFKIAQSAWKKAAKTNIFHPNAAARQISKRAKRIAAIGKSQET